MAVARKNMFEIDGHPLEHWEKDNFEPKRDYTCRIIYEPKEGEKFFHQTLEDGDYNIMRCLSTSLEQPYFSKYNRFFPQRGHFCCKACGAALYSYETKFDVDDGWPAYGACILGAIGIIPAEERKSQIEKEDKACMKIQAYVRGSLCRKNVENMLDEMIRELMIKKEKDSLIKIENNSFDSDKYDNEDLCSDEIKKSNGRVKGTGYILSRALGDNYTEIHCHRCKSHLGDVFAEENIGNHGEKYLEHHRVNGRSLKYMHTNLPTRTMTRASLLFADQSQRRRFGLPDPLSISDHQSSYQTSIPRQFSDPLSVSHHESAYQSRNRLKGRHKQSDLLSLNNYESSFQNRTDILLTITEQRQNDRNRPPPPHRNKISVDPLGSVSCHERMVTQTKTNTNSRRRPMRRGLTQSLVNIEERKAFLENSLQHSFH